MNYYGVVRSTDHLAHYGIKGMRWGVRKAIARGDQKALDKHFKKAAKKLTKLQDIGLNSKKYAAKSVAYGAAAAGTGTLAVGGLKTVANLSKYPTLLVANRYLKNNPDVNKAILQVNKSKARIISSSKNNKGIQQYYNIMDTPNQIEKFGNKHSVALGNTKSNIVIGKDKSGNTVYGNKLITLTNNDLYRIGMGAASLGLAAKSAQNAYRASHGAKYRAKAVQWKNAMDEIFAGTKYEGKYNKSISKKKRRR